MNSIKKSLLFSLLILSAATVYAADAKEGCNELLVGLNVPEEMPFFEKQKAMILDEGKVARSTDAGIEKALREEGFSEFEIKQRIADFHANKPNSDLRAMGDRTLEEVRQYYLGESIYNIDPQSVIGRYLSETGAQSKVVQYRLAPGSTEVGPPKLLIAVSQASWDAFQEINKSKYYMTVTGHANVIHRGNFYAFGGGGMSEARLPSVNTPMPFLMFKTTEAERLQRYLNEIPKNQGWGNALKQPWQLNGYCARGGYTCCTHWIGNVPIGDRMVNEYKFPLYNRPANEAVMQPLKQYVGNEPMQKIWKVPGHEQLAHAIGLEKSNLDGEFASPGWVIQSLMGPASTERVPVIFVVTPDHKGPLPDVNAFTYEQPW